MTTSDAASSPVDDIRLRRDCSVARNLYFGEIVEENLFPYPAIAAKDLEALGMIVESVERFMAEQDEDFARWDREARAARRIHPVAA